jgi:N-acetylglucosamine kinase-like BadF-type ATPase
MSAPARPLSIVGFDVGASGIRGIVEFEGGQRKFQSERPLPRKRGRVHVDQLSGVLAESAGDAIHPFDVICIGMAGLPDLVDAPERLAGLIAHDLGALTVVLAGDAVTTHIGALEFAAGTVIAAGTGVVALGTDYEQCWRRADGWGALLGDEGSGAWIGRRGLTAALRARDGRGGSTVLLERMVDEFGSVENAVDAIYSSKSPSYPLGRFAPVVAASAEEGDEISRAIWHEAGTLLAQTAVAASAEVGNQFSWGGGLFESGELLLAPFRAELHNLRPQAVLTEPAGASVDGALRLARAQRDGFEISRPPFIEVYRASSSPRGLR